MQLFLVSQIMLPQILCIQFFCCWFMIQGMLVITLFKYQVFLFSVKAR